MEILTLILDGIAIITFLFLVLVLIVKIADWFYEKFFNVENDSNKTGVMILIEIIITILFTVFLAYAVNIKTEYILKPNNELIEHNELTVFNKKVIEENMKLHYRKETTTSSLNDY